ncbi:MAG: FKBP-type peptidyl-prolyl cis-trans isomerase [Flavobacteriales bacterium]
MKKILTLAAAISILSACNKSDKNNTNNLPLLTNHDSASYALGLNIGQNLKGSGLQDINPSIMAQAIQDVMADKEPLFDEMMAMMVFQSYMGKAQEKETEANRAEGEKFLAENAKKDGINITASGLQYQIIKLGDGVKPTLESNVKVHYHGTVINGTVFDSSVERGEPISFPLSGVIQGWQEGLQLMPVGSKFKFYIPSDLAYGPSSPTEAIKPHSTLVFEVELLAIEN